MTAIERTAYPTWNAYPPHPQELEAFYTPTQEEHYFLQKTLRQSPNTKNKKARSTYEHHQLNFLVLLKCFQRLGYFPSLRIVPKVIAAHIAQHLKITHELPLGYQHAQMLYRHQTLIRTYLNVKPYTQAEKDKVIKIATDSSARHNYPADIINDVIETLAKQRIELPAYSELDRLIRSIRHRVNQDIFTHVHKSLPQKIKNKFRKLTVSATRTAFDRIKDLPKNTTVTHLKEVLEQHDWLMSFGPLSEYLKNISQIKLKQFSGETKSLDASNLREMTESKRYTLITCLIDDRQQHTKDDLVNMFIKTIKKIETKSETKLKDLREKNKEKTRDLLTLLKEMAKTMGKKLNAKRAKVLRKHLSNYGGSEAVVMDCETAIAYHTNNYLPIAWQACRGSRSALFSLLKVLNIYSNVQHDSLIVAKNFLLAHANSKKELLPGEIDLSFAPKEWQKLILLKEGKKKFLVRRYFEICVFICLADALKATDIYVEGSASYKNFNDILLSKEECIKLIPDYCQALNLAQDGKTAVVMLRQALADKANDVDKRYKKIKELVIDENGVTTLKKRPHDRDSNEVSPLQKTIQARMPKRKILDVLVNMNHYFGWATVFGPMSGSEPKMANAIEHYILTTFAYGTGMGPKQASDHMKQDISAHMLSWANRRHITPAMQNKAMAKLINAYCKYALPKKWGLGNRAIADGTMKKIYAANLIAEKHIRYGGVGGIAYHHIADNYIALFTTFISCGVWEAVEILEGLLKNSSELDPKIIHADTQGQSTVVFAIAYLLGIKLMPRIRNWKNLKFYRPSKNARYKHIHSLFKDTVDWKLIEAHWEEMLQLILSIKAGKVSSSLLLRKLGTYSKRNKLCLALRELGYVIRTQFLLEYVSDVELREEITAQTNKVESYNAFTEWLSFGNPYTIVASNDPEEHEKAVKYTDLIANAVMFQNMLDMSDVIVELHQEGYPILEEELSRLSPYLVGKLNRFGDYVVNMNVVPIDIHRAMTLPV